jgi:hypothetical protein
MADIDPNVLGTNIVIGKSRKNRKLSYPPSVGMVCCFASDSDYDSSECGGEYQVIIMILVNVSSNILVFIMILVNVIVNFQILIMLIVNVIVKVPMLIMILMKGIVKIRMLVLF